MLNTCFYFCNNKNCNVGVVVPKLVKQVMNIYFHYSAYKHCSIMAIVLVA